MGRTSSKALGSLTTDSPPAAKKPGKVRKRTPLWEPLANEAEAAQVSELQRLIAPDLRGLACAEWPDVTGELRLLRFLRGFDHSVPDALKAVRAMLATRKKYKMDSLHEDWAYRPCTHTEDFPHQAVVSRYMPGLPTAGLSVAQSPIVYQVLGGFEFRGILKEIGESGYLDFYTRQCESRMYQLHKLSCEQGRMVKMLMVLDVSNVSYAALTSPRWTMFQMKHVDKIDKTLAEGLSRIYIINAKQWMLKFYKSIEWWMPANTRAKVAFLGSDFREELLEVMDEGTLQTMLDFKRDAFKAAGKTLPDDKNDKETLKGDIDVP